jgi:hypothetical protein
MNANFRLTLILAAVVAASSPLAASQDAGFAGPIEKTHGIDAWRAKSAVSTEITVVFGGNKAIDGTLLMDSSGGYVRMELAGGAVLGYDSGDAWVAPAGAEVPGARFHVLTWAYFLAAPMKLRDPGTRLEDLGKRTFRDGRELPAARLTFADGVGDTPDDWYVLYRDDGGRLAGMAYIVTFGKSVEEAEKEPHAVTYDDFREVDGVLIPHRWQFWIWSEAGGIAGDPIGEATLRNVRFVEPAANAFTRPEDARSAEMP